MVLLELSKLILCSTQIFYPLYNFLKKLTAATVEMTAENFIFIEIEFFNEWKEKNSGG